MNHRVSIVIIGRNEEGGIRRCLAAALTAAEQIGGAELIYVDSHSTDNTVDIVRSHGFRCLTLPSTVRRCPSAGRYVGSLAAGGEFILFLDADTLIYKDFLTEAIACFDSEPRLGGCNGRIDDFTEDGEKVVDIEEVFEEETEVKWLRGPCCLYRREALLQAGSFDPDLAMEEEAELGLRIVKSGWLLKWIPRRMACHTRCYHGNSMRSIAATFRRDFRANRLGEITKTISRAFWAGNGLTFCWLRLRSTIVFVAWMSMAAGCLLLPDEYYPWTFAASIIVLGFAAISIKKRSIRQALLFIPSKFLNLVDILSGLHKIEVKSPRRSEIELPNVVKPAVPMERSI